MSVIVADTFKARVVGAAITTENGLNVGGALTATSFVGDGTGLTNVGVDTATINTGQLNVIGVATASSFVGNVTGNASGTAGGLTGTPDITIRNVTGVAATFTGVLTYEDVTNVDSVGIVTARSGIELGAAGVGGTITAVGNAEFAGIATVGGDVSIADKIIHTGDTNTAIRFPTADTIAAETGGSERLRITSGGLVRIGASTDEDVQTGEGADLQVVSTDAGGLTLARDDATVSAGANLGVIRSYGNDADGTYQEVAKIEFQADKNHGTGDKPGRMLFHTTADGASSPTERLRITSSGGFQFSNGLFDEKCFITAGKLSDASAIDLANGMVHYFTTQETTTSTPNLRINSSDSLQDAMDTGDVCTVTLITTAAAAGYAANLTIDGNAVTEEWIGGSAPSEGGSDGLDIYCYTIICIGTGTGDSGFKVIANLTNATN